jgi:hypothetical protein
VSNVVAMRRQRKAEAPDRWLTVKAFREELAREVGLPKPPSDRWLRDCYRRRGMPSKLVMRRYRMIPWQAALKWLRDEGLIP